jgi:hypothetical protein
MDSGQNELPPYLGSDETGGHHRIEETDYWLLDRLRLEQSPQMELSPDFVEKYHVASYEKELIERLSISQFASNGNDKVQVPLSGQDLNDSVTLISNASLSREEVLRVIEGKASLHDTFALHELRKFKERARDNKNQENRFRALAPDQLGFQMTTGDYRINGGFATRIVADDLDNDRLWNALRKLPEEIAPDTLIGEELTISDIISQQLVLQKSSDDPMFVVDVGGLAGMSWHRLANHFKKEVSENKLVFIVTSLREDFEESLRAVSFNYERGDLDLKESSSYSFKSSKSDLTDDDVRFMLQTKDLVHHLAIDLAGLFNKKVFVGDREVSLLGNVSLINDNDAVALHSLIPSVQLPILASMLSDVGVYKTSNISTVSAQKQDHTRARTVELYRTFDILIHEFGLEHVGTAEEGSADLLAGRQLNQIFLRKLGGPKIRAFLLPDQLTGSAM